MSRTLNIQFPISHPLVLGDVGWTFPPVCFPQAYCVYCFLQGGQSCWLSRRFSPSDSNNISSPCSSLPTTGRGVTIQEGLRGGTSPLVLGLLLRPVWPGTTLCDQKANQRFFSCSFGKPWASSINCVPANYEVSSSIGSREVRQFGFRFPAVAFWDCMKRSLRQECIWCGGHPCCTRKNLAGKKKHDLEAIVLVRTSIRKAFEDRN